MDGATIVGAATTGGRVAPFGSVRPDVSEVAGNLVYSMRSAPNLSVSGAKNGR